MDGVAARGLVNGRGPRRSRGRDVVGTCSDGTEPNLTLPPLSSYIKKKEMTLLVIPLQYLVFD